MASTARKFLPPALLLSLAERFHMYFLFSIKLCQIKAEKPLALDVPGTTDDVALNSFVAEIDAIFYYQGLPITLLIRPDFVAHITDFLKEKGNLDIEREVTLLNNKYKIALNEMCIPSVVGTLQMYLKKIIFCLDHLLLCEKEFIELAAQRGYGQATIYDAKLKFLDYIMVLVKDHIISSPKDQVMNERYNHHLKEIRDFLKKPDFGTKELTTQLREKIASVRIKHYLHSHLCLNSGKLRTITPHDQFSPNIGLEPTADFFESERIKKSELEEVSDAYCRLMSHHQQLSAAVDRLQKLEGGNTRHFLAACNKGNLKTVKRLYALIDDQVLTKAFYVACAAGQENIVRYLAKQISQLGLRARDSFNHLDDDEKKTPLMIVASKGYLAIVNILMSYSCVDVKQANSSNETALSLSTNPEVTKKIQARITQPPVLYGSGGLSPVVSTQTSPPVTVPDESKTNLQALLQYFKTARATAEKVSGQIAGLLEA